MAMFLVVLRRSGPRWDAARPLEEQSDWPAHAAYMDALVAGGFVVLGGPLADEHRVVLRSRPGPKTRSPTARARPVERDAPSRGPDRALDDPSRRPAEHVTGAAADVLRGERVILRPLEARDADRLGVRGLRGATPTAGGATSS